MDIPQSAWIGVVAVVGAIVFGVYQANRNKPKVIKGSEEEGPVFGSDLGRPSVTLSRFEDIKIALNSPEVYRGAVDSFPFPIGFILPTLFVVNGKWFFGQGLEDNNPDKQERIRYTVNQLQPTGIQEVAPVIAEAMRAGDRVKARKLTVEFFIRKFIPNFTVTQQDLDDIDYVGAMLPPSPLWLSPYHSWGLATAKARLAKRIGGKVEFFHHIIVASSVYTSVLDPITSQKVQKKIEAAGEAGFPVLRFFDSAVPQQLFRIVKHETDLNGLLPRKLPANGVIVLKLKHGEYRDHRLLYCCGQRIVTEFVEAVVRVYEPSWKLRPALPAPEPFRPALNALFDAQTSS